MSVCFCVCLLVRFDEACTFVQMKKNKQTLKKKEFCFFCIESNAIDSCSQMSSIINKRMPIGNDTI
jgi:hypothetical protein